MIARARMEDRSRITPHGHLAHQGEEVLFGVAKEGHPEIVIRHAGQEMRLVLEFDAGGKHLTMRRLNVRHDKIED
jgi:hypothetical protein